MHVFMDAAKGNSNQTGANLPYLLVHMSPGSVINTRIIFYTAVFFFFFTFRWNPE